MLTKIGQEVEKVAGLAGGITGLVRASNLSPEQREALIKEYQLSENASLVGRNLGRGVLGNIGGASLGSGVGMALGSLGGSRGATLGSGLGALIGAIYGSKKSTDKYSVGRANKILNRRQPE